MKKYFLFFSFVLFSAITHAETKSAVKEKSQANKEGISVDIDAARLKDIEQWVNNSKFNIDVGLKTIEKNSVTERERMYVNLINDVLAGSGTKPNEFLMRNILYRIQTIYEQVLRSTPPSAKRNAMVRRVLEDGVQWAVKLYQPDQKLLELAKAKQLPEELKGAAFASIGMQWAYFMMDVADDAPNNSSRLKLLKAMMGIMFNDINNDDAVKRVLAPVSKNFVTKWEEVERIDPSTPLDKLMLAKSLRQFMELHLEATKNLLESYKIPVSLDVGVETIPHASSNFAELSNIPSGACSADKFCVGQRFFNIEKNAFITILAIQSNGQYVIRFDTDSYVIEGDNGKLKGLEATNWPSYKFAKLSGCTSTNDACVGQHYYNTENNFYVTIAAIQSNGQVVVYYESGKYKGDYAAGWPMYKLAKINK